MKNNENKAYPAEEKLQLTNGYFIANSYGANSYGADSDFSSPYNNDIWLYKKKKTKLVSHHMENPEFIFKFIVEIDVFKHFRGVFFRAIHDCPLLI